MFDRYVAHERAPSRKLRLLIVVSVALHALGAMGLVVRSCIHVELVDPPPLVVTFFSGAPPPAAAAPPPKAGRKSATPKNTPKPQLTQPDPKATQPLVQPKEEEPDEDEGEEGGDPNGEKGGVIGGTVGGTVGGVAGGVVGGVIGGVGTGPVQKPKNVGPHQLDTQVIFRPDPHLPDVVKAQRKGMGDATFTAKVCVAVDGSVSQVQVLAGIPGADASIVSTIKTWKYKPQPIPVCFIANWVFTIQ